jgi:succinyl-diaminopimelate desuccinylase
LPDADGPGPVAAALAEVGAGEPTILADLGALVSFDTSYPPGRHYPEVMDWAAARLGALGFVCRRVEVPPALWDVPGAGAAGPRTNLVAELPDASGEPVGIYGHVDVVPAGEGWSTPPFVLTRQGEWLHGRGAADMKGAIAALLLALQALRRHGVALRHAPKLLLCTDEEGGAYPGIRYLAEEGEVPEHLLCLDGGAAPRLWTGAFGSLEMLVEIEGRAGHAGQHGSGDNALERAVPVMAALLALKQRVEARASALRGRDGGVLRPILALTVAQAGVKANIVPDLCRIALNRRYSPEEKDGAVLAEIEQAITIAVPPGTRWRLLVTGHLAAVQGADQGPSGPRWMQAMCEGFGWAAGEARSWGATSSSDMGWVQRARRPGMGREILIGGAISPDSRVHGANERVRIVDILGLARALVLYLAR